MCKVLEHTYTTDHRCKQTKHGEPVRGKVLATKPADLSLLDGIHLVAGKNLFPQLPANLYKHAMACAHSTNIH